MTDIINNLTDTNLIPMGRIISAFGIKGWVKIKPDTQTLDSLVKYKNISVLVNNEWVHKVITNYSIHGDVLNAKFEDVSDRDAAIALRGAIIAVPRNELPETAPDEYYLADLLGLNVYNKQQEYLGKVTNFIETGPSFVLVIKHDTTEHLIPFVAQYIDNVNLTLQTIIVDWGLDY